MAFLRYCGIICMLLSVWAVLQLIAINCWIAAGIYLVFILISYVCIRKGRDRPIGDQDDETFCKKLSAKDN
ncbi:unnamed protein product [Leptidea sinapis]|uniref:Uncharacterized protein n=1 Tax=Leptidea sinapis TaxID=189913 RepID=A0A5E4R565_9NEOP|nr:unnamed protein product [Leptidea sinapis]